MHRVLKYVAWIISYTLSPLTLLPVLFITILLKLHLPPDKLVKSLILLFGVGIGPILGVFGFLRYTKRINDWDIQIRSERHVLNAFVTITCLVLLVMLYQLHAYEVIGYALGFFFWFACYAVITLFWKISAHTGTATFFWLSLSHLAGTLLWWGPLLIFCMVWSRIYRKNHSLSQAIGGVIYSLLAFLIVRSLFLR
jgi:hypothetical protein